MLYYITGGERSGKSSFAQKLALELSNSPIYLATSRKWDLDHQLRINKHQEDRDDRWTTIEEEKNISSRINSGQVVVIDCVTLWLTNYYVDNKYDIDTCLSLAKEEINACSTLEADMIFISNEIGMGVHAATETGRKFTELQGWMNQYIAKLSDKAYFMVSGIAMTLK